MSDEAAISWPYSRVEEFMTKDPETLCESLKLTDVKGKLSSELHKP